MFYIFVIGPGLEKSKRAKEIGFEVVDDLVVSVDMDLSQHTVINCYYRSYKNV
jgi:hypothetical protein